MLEVIKWNILQIEKKKRKELKFAIQFFLFKFRYLPSNLLFCSCRSTSLDRVAREYRILPMTFGSKSSLIVPLLIPQFLPCSVSFVLLCINYGWILSTSILLLLYFFICHRYNGKYFEFCSLLSSLRYKWAELLTLKSFLDSKSSPSLSLVCTNWFLELLRLFSLDWRYCLCLSNLKVLTCVWLSLCFDFNFELGEIYSDI